MAADSTTGIEPPTVHTNDRLAAMKLSFGPAAWIVPTSDNTGFDITVWRQSPGPLAAPLVKVRLTFGPDLQPNLERLEFGKDGVL